MSLYDIIFTLLIYGGALVSIILIGLYIFSKFNSNSAYTRVSNSNLNGEPVSIVEQLRFAQKNMANEVLQQQEKAREYYYMRLETQILSKQRYTVLNEPIFHNYRNVSNF
jgi:hypothetical protein